MLRYSGHGFAVLALAAIAAFWPSYLARPFATIDSAIHVHAAAMASWCALLVAQAFLIRSGRTRWHRAIGALSYAIAPLVVAATLRLTQIRIQAVPASELVGAASFFYLPLSMTAMFAISYGLAMAFRRTPALHARFMVGTALSFIDPVGARLMIFYIPAIDGPLMQPITFALVDAVLLFAIWRDRRTGCTGKAAVAFPVLLGVFAIAQVLWFTLATSEAWAHLVAGFGSLWFA